jgi:hypothetical protein
MEAFDAIKVQERYLDVPQIKIIGQSLGKGNFYEGVFHFQSAGEPFWACIPTETLQKHNVLWDAAGLQAFRLHCGDSA